VQSFVNAQAAMFRTHDRIARPPPKLQGHSRRLVDRRSILAATEGAAAAFKGSMAATFASAAALVSTAGSCSFIRAPVPDDHLKDGPALVRDAPTSIDALDQSLRKDVESGYTRTHSLRALSPIRSARSQNGHVPLEVGHGCESIRATDENLQHCDLEIHCRTAEPIATSSAPSEVPRWPPVSAALR
jgi:hypothetical protein